MAEAHDPPRLPERTCIGCRRKSAPGRAGPASPAAPTARWPWAGPNRGGARGCAPGRSACFDAAVRRRAFGRALRSEVPAQELARLRERLLSEGVSASDGPTGRKLEGVGGA